MQVVQLLDSAHRPCAGGDALPDADLVLAFGPSANVAGAAQRRAWFDGLRDRFPRAVRVYCSTGGQIDGTLLHDDAIALTAVRFEHSMVRAASVVHSPGEASDAAGARLAASLPADGLRHVVVFADGVRVNGSALVRGLVAALPAGVTLTGGLAGDDERFDETVVGLDGPPVPGTTVAIGFYGDRLVVGSAAVGGWDRFGPDRQVTRSEGNVLHELDGESALALYRRYLGPFSDELPASGLLFPLALRTKHEDRGVVRSVLGIDEAAGSVRFAGDVPQGAYVRLMKCNTDHLLDAAAAAASEAAAGMRAVGVAPRLALLVSCVGRRWILGQRAEEELEAARAVLGPDVPMAGYYSYGEIARSDVTGGCELHNQTMTITTFGER